MAGWHKAFCRDSLFNVCMFCLSSDSHDAPSPWLWACSQLVCSPLCTALVTLCFLSHYEQSPSLLTTSRASAPWIQPPPSSLRSPHCRQILWDQLFAEHYFRHSQDHLLTYHQLILIIFDGMYFVRFRKKKTIFKHSVKLPKKYGYKKLWRHLNLNYLDRAFFLLDL